MAIGAAMRRGAISERNSAIAIESGVAIDERDHRRDDRPVDEDQRAELLGDRIPGLRPDEAQPELLDRRPGKVEDLPGDEPEERGRRERCGDGDPLEDDVSQTNALTPEIGLRRQGLIRRRRHGRLRACPTFPAWIFLISRYTKPFTEAGIGTKKSGGPNFCPAVTAQ